MIDIKTKPKYIKLYNIIKSGILSEEYQSGTKMQGENELAKQYDMSRQTVRQALALLEQDGLIERRQGSGTYISERRAKKDKSWRVAVITTYISEYIFPSMLRGIERELTNEGYVTVLRATHNRVDFEKKILEECVNSTLDGIIVEATKSALPNPNIGFYENIIKQGIPLVFFNGHYPFMENCLYAEMDDKEGGYTVTDYLVKKGHKKIAGIFKSDDIQGTERYSGYLKCLVDNNLPINDEWISWINSENRKTHITDKGAEILENIKDCTAIVCYNDEVTMKLLSVLEEAGRRVPEDLEIISFDQSLYSELVTGKFKSISHPKEGLGQLAARKLIDLIEGNNPKSERMSWGPIG